MQRRMISDSRVNAPPPLLSPARVSSLARTDEGIDHVKDLARANITLDGETAS